jgi:type IV pilus assembly protein PilQ
MKTKKKVGIVMIMFLLMAWRAADTSEDKTPPKYKGEVGDFYFYHADLQNVLLFFARQYKLNIVIDPGISGTVTCQMLQVPWDQALDLILRQQGLAMVEEGKVKRATKIKREAPAP